MVKKKSRKRTLISVCGRAVDASPHTAAQVMRELRRRARKQSAMPSRHAASDHDAAHLRKAREVMPTTDTQG